MDATQKQINKMMGISDEVFEKYNSSTTRETEKTRRAKFDLGAADATETQLVVNKMMGISEETWKKYNPNSTQEAGKDGRVTIIQSPGIPLQKKTTLVTKRDDVVTIIPKLSYRGVQHV